MLSFFSRNIRKKAISVLFLTLIGLGFSLSQVKSADDSIGDFDLITAENNPFILLNWFYTEDIIDPLVDVEFNVTVYDEDNTSDELSVKLYYSDDVFSSTNVSVALVFDEEISPHNYTYLYVISGQVANVKIYYYYIVYDGLTLERKPDLSDEFYDVLWASVVTVERYYDPPEKELVDRLVGSSAVFLLIFITIILLLILIAGKKKS